MMFAATADARAVHAHKTKAQPTRNLGRIGRGLPTTARRAMEPKHHTPLGCAELGVRQSTSIAEGDEVIAMWLGCFGLFCHDYLRQSETVSRVKEAGEERLYMWVTRAATPRATLDVLASHNFRSVQR